MKKVLILSSLIAAMPIIAEAGGLELYSYHDDQGQLIVVDSLERIPARYRAKAARNFIPSFKDHEGSSKNKIDTSTVNKVKLSSEEPKDNVVVSRPERKVINLENGNEDSEDLDVIEAPEEVEPPDPGLETANTIVSTMSKILENNRQIYNLVLSTKQFSPATKNFQTQNVALLARITNPSFITWKRKHAQKSQWGSNAAQLLERFRTIQYTVTKWFGENPHNLLYGMPAFIEASQGHLNQLNNALEALRKLDEKLIEEESKKKKK